MWWLWKCWTPAWAGNSGHNVTARDPFGGMAGVSRWVFTVAACMVACQPKWLSTPLGPFNQNPAGFGCVAGIGVYTRVAAYLIWAIND